MINEQQIKFSWALALFFDKRVQEKPTRIHNYKYPSSSNNDHLIDCMQQIILEDYKELSFEA